MVGNCGIRYRYRYAIACYRDTGIPVSVGIHGYTLQYYIPRSQPNPGKVNGMGNATASRNKWHLAGTWLCIGVGIGNGIGNGYHWLVASILFSIPRHCECASDRTVCKSCTSSTQVRTTDRRNPMVVEVEVVAFVCRFAFFVFCGCGCVCCEKIFWKPCCHRSTRYFEHSSLRACTAEIVLSWP